MYVDITSFLVGEDHLCPAGSGDLLPPQLSDIHTHITELGSFVIIPLEVSVTHNTSRQFMSLEVTGGGR